MANKVVGEMNLKLGGKEYLLRPSFLCFAEIEDRAECGVMSITDRMVRNDLRIKHVAAILFGGVRGGLEEGEKMPFTFEEFQELVAIGNYLSCFATAYRFLNTGLQGRPVEGEPAQEKKTKSKAKDS